MVIDDLNVIGLAALEAETYAPLIVDTDAPFPESVALQRFQSVIRRDTQIFRFFRPVEHRQLAQSHNLDVHEAGNPLAVEQGFRVGALERRDHESMLTNGVSIVKCYLHHDGQSHSACFTEKFRPVPVARDDLLHGNSLEYASEPVIVVY